MRPTFRTGPRTVLRNAAVVAGAVVALALPGGAALAADTQPATASGTATVSAAQDPAGETVRTIPDAGGVVHGSGPLMAGAAGMAAAGAAGLTFALLRHGRTDP
ncbi:hypothetical protein [Streptomyces sp. NPDC090022]|uniref:hypothetical protein n=1 Tax=Streptomyces sp. NPDC090022 TaxID=3365920 RepID=UPI0037F91F0A